LYNLSLYKRIQSFQNQSKRFTSLNILQDFMNTIGNYSTVEEKIEKINEIVIEKYGIKL